MCAVYRCNNPGHDVVRDHFFGEAKSPQNVPAGAALPGALAIPHDDLPVLLTSRSMVGSRSKPLKKSANQEQAKEDKLPGAVSFIAKTPRNHINSEVILGFAGSQDELASEKGPSTPHTTNVEDTRSSSFWPWGRLLWHEGLSDMPAVQSSPQSQNSTDQLNVVSEDKPPHPTVTCVASSQMGPTPTPTRARFGGL